ncbi:hypothetical protein [Photobacterium damselae]|uniref:hypothetical protein n=1 Tax=Photobacterium damselae TaxID=38293 RepID=UPI0035A8C121
MSWLFNRLIISVLLVGLFGCGGSGDGSDENTPLKKISISAQDTLKLSQFNTQTTIDLRSRVQAENNESLLISDVKSITGDCDILSVDGLSFNVYSRHPDVCRFEYTVAPASGNYTGSAKALSQVVLNEDPKKGEYLPPISRTMLKNQSIRFNSSDLVEPGYVLDPSSVFALSGTGTSEIGKLSDISESGFTYQAPNTETIVRIFYSIINQDNNVVKPGVVYIAIGQNTNASPSAPDKTLEAGTLLDISRTINIAGLVSDADGDELQLVYARGVIGKIDITGNLEFQYGASSTGHEYITYVVTDHNGGYGIGLLDFTISTYPLITDTAQKLTFLPPMTMDSPELSLSSGSYYETGADGFQGFYPIFTHALASSYCITQGGRLPTEAELATMWKNVINKPVFQSKFKWHSSLPYLTDIESKRVSLIDGQESSSTDPAYFSCVISTEEPEWKFSSSFSSEKLNVPFLIYETAQLDSGMTIYRDEADYKLQAETLKFLINGTEADLKDVNVVIDHNKLTINAKNVSPADSVYIKVKVTDDDLVGQSSVVTVGFKQCASGTTPKQSLIEGCIYPVTLNNGISFTLAIPTNILGSPPEDLKAVKIFGQDGVSFVGTPYPNVQKWYNYIDQVCRRLNDLKLNGRTNWAAGISISATKIKTSLPSSADYEASLKWLNYMLEHDDTSSEKDPINYGQGYAGLPMEDYVVNQDSDKNAFETQEYNRWGSTYTFASCVSPNPS